MTPRPKRRPIGRLRAALLAALSRVWVRDAQALLASFIVHLALLLWAMMMVSEGIGDGYGDSLSIESGRGDAGGEFEMLALPDVALPDAAASSSAAAQAPLTVTQSLTSPTFDVPPVTGVSPQPLAGGAAMLTSEAGNALLAAGEGGFAEVSLSGRGAGSRGRLAAQGGGGGDTERAVEEALKWIAAHQAADGHWSTHFAAYSRCNCSRSSTEVNNTNSFAGTGLALLAFLGAGYTHQGGPYSETVEAGLRYLTENIPLRRSDTPGDKRVGQMPDSIAQYHNYEQGIATLALCEAYQMTHDSWLLPYCEAATTYIASAQHYDDGSWGYQRNQPGDLTITAWQLFALRSAAASGLDVSGDTLRRASRFLDSQRVAGSFYTYPKRDDGPLGSTEMTAIGGMLRLILGMSKTHPEIFEAAHRVMARDPKSRQDDGPELTDVYFNYYATNLLFYSGSKYWDDWNERLKLRYLSSQCTEGHERGSWFAENSTGTGFSNKWSDNGRNLIGGRLYTTAMCCLTLQVYYRYLPIQQDPDHISFKL